MGGRVFSGPGQFVVHASGQILTVAENHGMRKRKQTIGGEVDRQAKTEGIVLFREPVAVSVGDQRLETEIGGDPVAVRKTGIVKLRQQRLGLPHMGVAEPVLDTVPDPSDHPGKRKGLRLPLGRGPDIGPVKRHISEPSRESQHCNHRLFLKHVAVIPDNRASGCSGLYRMLHEIIATLHGYSAGTAYPGQPRPLAPCPERRGTGAESR